MLPSRRSNVIQGGRSTQLPSSTPYMRPLSLSGRRAMTVAAAGKQVTLLDYGAGNVRSVRNAITKLGYTIKDVEKASDITSADKLIFPGVGSFGQAMQVLRQRDLIGPLKDYLAADRPFLGICLGLQLLFDGSEESGGCEGLGIIPGQVAKFDTSLGLPVPHIGWNDLEETRDSGLLSTAKGKRVYFVHSYRGTPSEANKDWVLSSTHYGVPFISTIGKGNVYATQFHPEKSGITGLNILQSYLDPLATPLAPLSAPPTLSSNPSGLAKRVIACLDVRSNDQGDLVVTKGDQYDVREKDGAQDVRNLGLPVDLAARYYEEGADEVTFLNITAFRDGVLGDMPMLEVLRKASERVFVPLTVGGGIRGFTAGDKSYTALEVASEYFRSGADKVSIGSDAVQVAEDWVNSGGKLTGETSIEQISAVYGKQAVVVSIDPRRVYVSDPSETKHKVIKTAKTGPNGEQYCWWQCTIKGGREGRDIDAVELAVAVEALGAGEILLNCIDNDGVGKGFDLELVGAVSSAVSIPVIASSGAGVPDHFSEVFAATKASAALAAGIFHRREVAISDVKSHMADAKIPTRL